MRISPTERTDARQTGARQIGTRQRILDASLALFNQRAPAQVTTAEIAEATGIAEGNLHYHFRKKADLLVALYDVFEAEVVRVAARDLGGGSPPLEAYVEYQRDWFRLMWTHRWFYRDTVALFAIAPELRPRVRAGTARAQRLVRSVLDRMVEGDLLRATPAQAERLLTNAWIVSTYWIDYLRLTADRDELREADLDWGYAQVLALYAPFLTAKGTTLDRTGMVHRRPRRTS